MFFFRSTLCAYILFNKLGSIIDHRIGCLYWTHMLWHESEARCGMMNILNWFKSTQISRWQIQYIFIVPCIYRSIITWLFGHLTIENKAIGHRLSFNFWAPGRVNKPEKRPKRSAFQWIFNRWFMWNTLFLFSQHSWAVLGRNIISQFWDRQETNCTRICKRFRQFMPEYSLGRLL